MIQETFPSSSGEKFLISSGLPELPDVTLGDRPWLLPVLFCTLVEDYLGPAYLYEMIWLAGVREISSI